MHLQTIAGRVRCHTEVHDPRDCVYCEAAHWLKFLMLNLHFDTYSCGHAIPNDGDKDMLLSLLCPECHMKKFGGSRPPI